MERLRDQCRHPSGHAVRAVINQQTSLQIQKSSLTLVSSFIFVLCNEAWGAWGHWKADEHANTNKLKALNWTEGICSGKNKKHFFQHGKEQQINTLNGSLHIAEPPDFGTDQSRRCCSVWGYQVRTRSTWTSNCTKLPIPPPVLSSLLAHQPEGA